jgi:hypothetical protein
MRRYLSHLLVLAAGGALVAAFYETRDRPRAAAAPDSDGRAMTIDYPPPGDERRSDGSLYRRAVRLEVRRVERGTSREVYGPIPGDDREWVVMFGGTTYFLYPVPR